MANLEQQIEIGDNRRNIGWHRMVLFSFVSDQSVLNILICCRKSAKIVIGWILIQLKCFLVVWNILYYYGSPIESCRMGIFPRANLEIEFTSSWFLLFTGAFWGIGTKLILRRKAYIPLAVVVIAWLLLDRWNLGSAPAEVLPLWIACICFSSQLDIDKEEMLDLISLCWFCFSFVILLKSFCLESFVLRTYLCKMGYN